MSSRSPGAASASSMGSPVIAVVTSTVALLTSFIHMVGMIWSVTARRPSAAGAPQPPLRVRPDHRAAHRRRTRIGRGPECRSTSPGTVIVDEISMTVPIVRAGPTTSAMACVDIPVLHAGPQTVLPAR